MPLGQTVALIACVLIMLTGLAAIILPLVPAIPFIWLGVFLYALVSGFEKISIDFIFFVSFIGLITIILDYVVSSYGVKKFRASVFGLTGALIGGLFGFVFGPLYGLVVGPLIGAIIGETIVGRDILFSYQTKKYTIIGLMGGTVVKVIAGVAIVGLFFWQLVR
ncbi:MAG: DUF456 domain-containing protein [Patescibacteria group bacterium]